MHLAQKNPESPAEIRRQFAGNMFIASTVWDLSRPQAVKVGALTKFVSGSPAQKHTLSSAKELAAERVFSVAGDRALPSGVFESASRLDGVTPRIAVWVAHLHNARSDAVGEISTTLSLLLERLDVSGPVAVSGDLETVDVALASPHHLLATLRALFRQRHSIPEWRRLERRTRAEFEKRSLNPTRVMRGLDVDD